MITWANQKLQNAPLLSRVVSYLTITDPAHPLFNQTLPVVWLPASSMHEPFIVVELPTGEHRRVPRAATDLAATRDDSATVSSPLPISVRTLLPLAHAVRRLLVAREDHPDENPVAPAGAASRPSPDPDRHPPAASLAQPDARPTPLPGAVPSRTDSTPAPGAINPHRGGAT